jgi:hypothetical protein
MNYSDEDIQGLMNDLSTVGLSHRVLVNKTHYGFGKDLQGVNDGKTLFYITREGADLLQESEFGKWIRNQTFAINWSKWHFPKKRENPNNYWTRFPLPAADKISENLLEVTLFLSSPRSHFPGRIPQEKVKEGYDLLVDEIKKVKLPDLG